MDLHFDVFYKEHKVGHIDVVNNIITNNILYNTDKEWFWHPFPKVTDFNNLFVMLKERLMPECRWTKEVLDSVGEKEYNVYRLIRKTHGIDADDFWWFRFDDEPNITYNDVKVRE